MPSQSSRTKLVASALAFTLLAGGVPAILPAQSAYAAAVGNTPFTDVSAGHWAEKHIAKLALQGIVNGYVTVNGTSEFRPAKSVTQEEAIVMALRFAGLQNEVQVGGTVTFPDTFKVGAYFKPYVKLALDKGILDEKEEFAIAAGNGGKGWGDIAASREWITKLLVRAIGENNKALQLANTKSSFNDDGQIASNYRGYVNASVSLGLVKGVTADKFDPKAPVNRMSLAALFSRAEALFPVQYEGQISGIVTKLSSSSVTVYNGGTEQTYTVGSDTLFYRADSDTAIAASAVKLYTKVSVIAKSGKALYLESLSDEQQIETITAKLDRVNAAGKYIYVWINDEPVKINFGDDLTILDVSGNTIKLADLKRDSSLTITLDKFRDQRLAVKLVADQQTGAGTVKGQFFIADNTIITYVDANKQPVTKFLASKVDVTIPGISSATLDDLVKEADEIELTINDNDRVTAVKVVNRNVETLNGATVESYSPDKKMMVIIDATGKNASIIYLNDKTKIDYNGKAISVADAAEYLTKGRKLNINASGQAAISVQFIYKQTGVITSINTSSSTLSLNDGKSIVSVPYVSGPTVELGGQSYGTLTDLKVGDTVTALLDSNQTRASTIQLHKTYQYTVTSINSQNKRVTVSTGVGSATRDLDLSGIDITDEKGTKLTVDKLSLGTNINVAYIGKAIQYVKAIEYTYGTIQSVNTTGFVVGFKNGTTKSVSVGASFKVNKGTSSAANLSLLQAGDIVEVYLDAGDTVIVNVAVGEQRTFTSYSAADSTLWTLMTSSADNANFFRVTEETKVTYKGDNIAISTLKSGDTIVVYGFRNKAYEIKKV
ncbi:S-layer homology domain-containing protein [Paenibacillus gorillae]|uniref:S-layer homology domain-containing protein n=1 Tax=Paenibacillus gorillae TaxID=1243662 RepID=UPI0004ACCA15|nr:S-layer homology domain-containing protein [Paenibacillus gorillae]